MTRAKDISKILTDADISGTLDATGIVTANAGIKVDNITIDGTEIDLSSGDLTVDVAGNILLNADGGGIYFQDATTLVGSLQNSSSDLVITSEVQDKDILFKGDDGGASVTALTLDMSDDGTAIFNHDAKITSGNIQFGASGSETGQIEINGGRLLQRSTGDASGLRFDGSAYTPFKNGSAANGTVDIGSSGAKYRDIFISGGLMIGGNTSANALADFEEGTWTLTQGGQGTFSSPTITGKYTKIGQMVRVQMEQTAGTISYQKTHFSGLPFAVNGHGYKGIGGATNGALDNLGNIVAYSGTTLIYPLVGGGNQTNLIFSITYFTDA